MADDVSVWDFGMGRDVEFRRGTVAVSGRKGSKGVRAKNKLDHPNLMGSDDPMDNGLG